MLVCFVYININTPQIYMLLRSQSPGQHSLNTKFYVLPELAASAKERPLAEAARGN